MVVGSGFVSAQPKSVRVRSANVAFRRSVVIVDLLLLFCFVRRPRVAVTPVNSHALGTLPSTLSFFVSRLFSREGRLAPHIWRKFVNRPWLGLVQGSRNNSRSLSAGENNIPPVFTVHERIKCTFICGLNFRAKG